MSTRMNLDWAPEYFLKIQNESTWIQNFKTHGLSEREAIFGWFLTSLRESTWEFIDQKLENGIKNFFIENVEVTISDQNVKLNYLDDPETYYSCSYQEFKAFINDYRKLYNEWRHS